MNAAVSAELEHIWSRVQAEVARAVDEPTYRIWLEPLRALELSETRLSIETPPHSRAWVHERFGSVLQASTTLVVGPGVAVELLGGPVSAETVARGFEPKVRRGQSASDKPLRKRGDSSERGEHARAGESAVQSASHSTAGPLGNPKLTFDQFVIGDCNRLAHAAALTVAEMPAQAYNPLFICGPPGVGKTHLLSSIASLLLSHSPGATVRCTTGEVFTNEFLEALSGGQTNDFKERFRRVDVLLLDDVQFLERKTKTEEEFFHTFNALHDAGRQIVLTSDRPPHDLQALEDRLRERFEAGLVADIKPPELATRMTILRKRAHQDGVELDDLALVAIAERVTNNVRALEGALIRVVAFSSLTGRPVTAALANEVLDTLYPRARSSLKPRSRSIAEIQAAACEHFDLSPEELLSPARTQRIAWPRQVAMYLARELTDESLPAIGRHFGGRDHTTVLHAWRRTAARVANDEVSRQAVESLCKNLDPHPVNPPPPMADRSA